MNKMVLNIKYKERGFPLMGINGMNEVGDIEKRVERIQGQLFKTNNLKRYAYLRNELKILQGKN